MTKFRTMKYAVNLLLILVFNHLQAQNEDCVSALRLCNKNQIVVNSIIGVGNDDQESGGSCLVEGLVTFKDAPTKWFYWLAENDGTLTFTITPFDTTDDIDFALYELPNGIHNCNDKLVLRCNATSPPCAWKTGLNLISQDSMENFNCDVGEDGFCKFLEMKKDHYYGLMISEFSSIQSGMTIDWRGDGLFSNVGCNSVSVENTTLDLNFIINPNPVEDQLLISFVNTSNDDELIFSISNLDGKLLCSYKVNKSNENRIDVSQLKPGIYIGECSNKKNALLKKLFIKN